MVGLRTIVQKFHGSGLRDGDSWLKVRQARDLSAFLLLYSVLNGMIYAISGGILFTAVFAWACLAEVLILRQTFRRHITAVFRRLILLVIALSVICTWVIGKKAGYQDLLYCGMLYGLFDPETSVREKRILSAGAVIYVVVSILFSGHVSRLCWPGGVPEGVLDAALALNELMLIGTLVMFCMNYAVKKGESDYQLYLYNTKLQTEAGTDPLTGLPNRRGFEIILSRLEEEYRRQGIPMTLVMGDIDLFKRINDTYGHDAGDAVLKQLAGIMMDFMEERGAAARWGGEEFLLVFSGMNGDIACTEVEKLRRRIEITPFRYQNTDIPVRMTFGVEEYDAELQAAGTVRRADEKLYLGKQKGRNRVVY